MEGASMAERQEDRDQQDLKWRAWLERMDEQLKRFLGETVPDMPDNPWTAEGLRRAEEAALRFFADMDSVDLPENSDRADQFHRFIGEVFRRNFEGEWYNVHDYDDPKNPRGFGPVILDPFSAEYLTIFSLLTSAMHRRTGNEWSEIFRNVSEEYDAWCAAGRPSRVEWANIRDAEWL